MPRARTSSTNRQAAVSPQGNGCLSGFLLPPFAVLVVGILLGAFVKGLNPTVHAESLSDQGEVETISSPILSPIFTAEVQYWSEPIIRWASHAGVDPNLAAVVMQIESCGDPRARSHAGAMGLFQVMPYHFAPNDNPYQPDTNALRGLGYLKRSLETAGGNSKLALAGYNGGIGIISRGETAWSSETIRYVHFGAPIFEDADRGAASSPMLEEWYRRYGVNLCKQAHQRLGLGIP